MAMWFYIIPFHTIDSSGWSFIRCNNFPHAYSYLSSIYFIYIFIIDTFFYFIYLFIHLFIYLSVSLFIYLFIYLSLYLSIYYVSFNRLYEKIGEARSSSVQLPHVRKQIKLEIFFHYFYILLRNNIQNFLFWFKKLLNHVFYTLRFDSIFYARFVKYFWQTKCIIFYYD